MLFLTILVVIYLSLIGYAGYCGFRGTRTASDYLVAGRQMHPVLMSLSYGSTFISTSAIVGFGGAAAVFGMGLLWLTFLNIFVGIFIAFIVIGKRTRAMGHHLNAHTLPELLGKRYDSKGLQVFCGLIILVFMPLYAAVVLMGGAKFIQVRLQPFMSYETALFVLSIIVALYVVMGGLKAVIYTDAMQGAIMLAGMTVFLVLAYSGLGGVVPAHEKLTALAPQAVAVFGKGGHRGWTAMPEFGSPMWWTLVSTIVMGVGIGVLAQPQLIVRFMTVKGSRELNRGVVIGGFFILMMTGVAFVSGALSNVYFYEKFQKISMVFVNKDVEQIIPRFIVNFMPSWLGDLFMITLLAAAMSTISSQFHTMGTAAGRDLYETLAGGAANDRRTILATRIGIIATLVFSVFLAYILPVKMEKGMAIIASGTAIFFALCAATFLPMFLGGLYFRFITRSGAFWGGFTGFLASALWLVFVHDKEAKALLICQALFQKTSLLFGVKTGKIVWQEVDALFVALPLSLLVTIIVSMATKKLSKEHLDNCFAQIK